MPLNLCDYDSKARKAIKAFWQSRDDAKKKQKESGSYDLICQKLAKEQLYSAAAVIATPRTAVADGVYFELSAMTGLRSFVASFAGHIAAEAAR